MILLVTHGACGSKQADKPNEGPNDQPTGNIELNKVTEDELNSFFNLTPVLAGGKAFASEGHGGGLVKSFLNDVAKTAAESGAQTMPEGALFAKAVVTSESQNPATASRVYFMKKQKSGYDPDNSNWAYFVANPVNGKLVLSTLDPISKSCVSCHKLQKEHDYVRTILIYKTQTVQ